MNKNFNQLIIISIYIISLSLLTNCNDDKPTNIQSLKIQYISPDYSYIGDIVTIYGNGFGETQGESEVKFYGALAEDYVSWTDTEIKVKVPSNARTGKLYITVNAQKSNEVDIIINTSIVYGFLTDIDNNTYKTIKIGNQVWMAENLNVTHYRNGDYIEQVSDNTNWTSIIAGAWCYYKNDIKNSGIYGKLYNWYAVNDPRGLAPVGWHIPTDDEWKELELYLGIDTTEANEWNNRGESGNVGAKLKEAGTNHWYPNSGANNESGFLALPGGYRDLDLINQFDGLGFWGEWWTSTRINNLPVSRVLYGSYTYIGRFQQYENFGLSVRCVKD